MKYAPLDLRNCQSFMMTKVVDMQVIEYGYSILTYAIRYDSKWIDMIEKLKAILQIYEQQTHLQHIGTVNSVFQPTFFPDESVYQVMQYLDNSDLRKVSLVCLQWNDLASRDKLWNNLLKKDFGVCSENIQVSRTGDVNCTKPKVIYKEMMFSFYNVLENMNGVKMERQPVIPSYMIQHFISV